MAAAQARRSVLKNNMENEYTEIIDLGFSVADAEDPKFLYDGENLKISFIDWNNKSEQLLCSNVIAFRWQRAEYQIDENERFDSTHIVHNSKWLKLYNEQNETWPNAEFQHYKLNFNAAGILEIICTEIKKTEPVASQDPRGSLA